MNIIAIIATTTAIALLIVMAFAYYVYWSKDNHQPNYARWTKDNNKADYIRWLKEGNGLDYDQWLKNKVKTDYIQWLEEDKGLAWAAPSTVRDSYDYFLFWIIYARARYLQ